MLSFQHAQNTAFKHYMYNISGYRKRKFYAFHRINVSVKRNDNLFMANILGYYVKA